MKVTLIANFYTFLLIKNFHCAFVFYVLNLELSKGFGSFLTETGENSHHIECFRDCRRQSKTSWSDIGFYKNM